MKNRNRLTLFLISFYVTVFPILLFAQRNWKRPEAAFSRRAVWIQPGFQEDSAFRPCPIFRKEFDIDEPVKSATVTISAHGLYEARLDDHRIGNDWFTPGYTDYHKRLQYQQYEV